MLIPLEKLIADFSVKVRGIVHIGACALEEKASYTNAGLSHNDVLWFEANPVMVSLMKMAHPLSKIYNFAIGNRDDDSVTLHVANNFQSSSILNLGVHRFVHPDVTYESDVQVCMRRMKTLVEDKTVDISNANFLNIDIQGYELEALKGFDELLHQFDYLYLEINCDYLYEGCPLVEEIDAYVARFGFKRVATEWCGRWGDGFYIKL